MRKLLLLTVLCAFATIAFADEYTEDFPDPLGGWKDRWLGQNTNMQNYYVCTGGGDENFRGNNPCGLWICDGNAGNESVINFNPDFGATITHFDIGIEIFVPSGVLTVYDIDGAVAFSVNLQVNGGQGGEFGCGTDPFGGDTPNGVSRFEITAGGNLVEGNTAIDNVHVTAGEPTAVETTNWGSIKALYR
jgi:hypothetical protein